MQRTGRKTGLGMLPCLSNLPAGHRHCIDFFGEPLTSDRLQTATGEGMLNVGVGAKERDTG